jgi:hypothetical protein
MTATDFRSQSVRSFLTAKQARKAVYGVKKTAIERFEHTAEDKGMVRDRFEPYCIKFP